MLTGPSGAGKTTLLRLLLRFIEPTAGAVCVGGTDLAAVPVEPWRAQIAWVPQHPRLFPGSVADNIALGQPGVSRAAIEDAARLAGAVPFIEALPHGYDTLLGERAAELSAGQRQQLALARAFLRDAPLLLLDEPTAHLAPAAAAAIDSVIRGAMAGRTIIVATHRHPDLVGASQVITLRRQARGHDVPAGRRAGHDGRQMTARPATAGLPGEGRPPLLRLLEMARPLRGRLLGAAAAGAAATSCGVALLAVSGFLLARASQHPAIIAISVAVVAVRALSVGRGLSRYLERLASHDVAFRVLAQVRVAIWRRLEALAPAGVAVFRSGDLLARLISDVDATQDVFIRGITPALAAALVGGGAVTVCLLILAPAAAVLAAGLLTAGIVVPLAGAAVARTAARAAAPARGRLAATVTDLLAGAADLQAFGADDAALARADAADAELTRLEGRTAAASALGAGLMSAVTGLTVWGVLLLGVAATGTGALSRVPLAVITLTALAAFEAVTTLPAAAVQLARPASPRAGSPPSPTHPTRSAIHPVRERCHPARSASSSATPPYGTGRTGRPPWTGSAWTCRPGGGSRWSAPTGPASPPSPRC